MKTILTAVALVAALNSAEASELESCLGAIKAYGDSFNKRTDLPPNAVAEGVYAAVNTKYNDWKGSYSTQRAGSKTDIHGCVRFGVHNAAIQTIVAFDNEPLPVVFKSQAQCTAVMISLAPKIEKEFGMEEAAEIGSRIGTAMGQSGLVFKYMLKVSDLSAPLLREEARKLIAVDSSPKVFNEWVQACDRIGVEVHPVVDRLRKNGRL